MSVVRLRMAAVLLTPYALALQGCPRNHGKLPLANASVAILTRQTSLRVHALCKNIKTVAMLMCDALPRHFRIGMYHGAVAHSYLILYVVYSIRNDALWGEPYKVDMNIYFQIN